MPTVVICVPDEIFLGFEVVLRVLSLKVCLLFKDSVPGPDMEEKLRSASSVDELMTLIYPSYWATLKCTSRLSSVAASSRPRFSQRPPASMEDAAFSAVYLNLDILKSTTLYILFLGELSSDSQHWGQVPAQGPCSQRILRIRAAISDVVLRETLRIQLLGSSLEIEFSISKIKGNHKALKELLRCQD